MLTVKNQNRDHCLEHENTDFLIEMGCKLIVVVCNTATTNAIQELRAKYSIPSIGIEPAINLLYTFKNAGHRYSSYTRQLNSELFNKTTENIRIQK
jgi:glutamate racemase